MTTCRTGWSISGALRSVNWTTESPTRGSTAACWTSRTISSTMRSINWTTESPTTGSVMTAGWTSRTIATTLRKIGRATEPTAWILATCGNGDSDSLREQEETYNRDKKYGTHYERYDRYDV